MPKDFAELLENLPSEPLPVSPPRKFSKKTLRWIELLLVLSVAFGNSIFGSIQILTGTRGTTSLGPEWGNSILHELIGLFLLAYVLYRRGWGFADLGLSWSQRDILRGIGLSIAALFLYYLGCPALAWIHRLLSPCVAGGVTAREMFGHTTPLAVLLLLINPFYEELIVRAYLMTELRELTGSSMLAVAASVAVQTSYHLYYGWVSAMAMSLGFLLFSIYYARARRAAPIVLAHGLLDFLGAISLR